LRGLLELDRSSPGSVRVRRWKNGHAENFVGGASAHPWIEVAWVESGCAVYRVDGEEIRIGPGGAMIVPAQTEHQTTIFAGTRAGSIGLEPAVLAEVADEVGVRSVRTSAVSAGARIAQIGRMLSNEIGSNEPAEAILLDSLATALAVEALRLGPFGRAESARDARIRRVIDCIHTRYAERLSAEELAQVAGLSRFHFMRTFRRETGKSPHHYLQEVRINAAAQLLKRGRVNVTEAALSVGFTDLGRFSRAFKRQVGLRPSEVTRSVALRPQPR
jgi:AraC-like DNA-binding protein